MSFTSGKKGTKKIPRDPHNRHNYHPNPGGVDNPPSDPATTAAAGVRNIDRGVLSDAATKYIDWLRKDDIEEKNKVLKRTFDTKIEILQRALATWTMHVSF